MSAHHRSGDRQLPPPTAPSLLQAHRRKRLKIETACDRCRSRKVRCDGVRPACGNCARKREHRESCCYGTNANPPLAHGISASLIKHHIQSTRPPNENIEFIRSSAFLDNARKPTRVVVNPPRPIAVKPSEQSSPPTLLLPSTLTVDSMTAVSDEPGTEFFGSSSAGSFTAQIKAAVEARLVNCPAGHPCKPPVAVRSRATPTTRRRRHDIINKLRLPTRKLADELMQTYWLYIDPLYPFLNKSEWRQHYARLFAGQPLDTDEAVFTASLNVVFALSTQLHEGQDVVLRNETSRDFFQRAKDLIDVTIWTPGTLEVIQYLLVTSQYLQSTNSPHQTWMVVGMAVRIAQSLGLHLPETSAARASTNETELYRKLWHGCVVMDRMVALTHGRPAMISAELAAAVPRPSILKDGAQTPKEYTDVAFFVKSAGLYEITHRLVETLYSAPSPPEKRVGSSKPAVSELANVIQIDGDGEMAEWEQSLPKKLLQHSLGTIAARPSIILRLRFLHARILLLRPILSRLCLTPDAEQTDAETLANKLHRQCALECVAVADATIQILSDHQVSDGTVGLLPAWWYRLYYLFSASTVLIAAKLRPDVFPTDEIHHSWKRAIHVFEVLQQVSLSARKCIVALNILSSRILATKFGAIQAPEEATEPQNVQAIPTKPDFTSNHDEQSTLDEFDANLDCFNFDVDVEDYSWLNEVTSWNFLSG